MLVRGFPAAAFDTNCWVVAPAAGEECVVIDPGIGVEDRLDEILREDNLKPVAVLLTHGHRPQVVLAQDLVQPGLHADAGVDDDALLAGGRRDDPAVRVEGRRREPADQHDRPLSSVGAVRCDPTGGRARDAIGIL